MKDAKKKQMILQVSNSKVKSTLRHHMGYAELGPGKYFDTKPNKIQSLSLDIRRGFKLTLCPIGN